MNQLRQIHPEKSDAWLWDKAREVSPEQDPIE
jgi:hypothetical protein